MTESAKIRAFRASDADWQRWTAAAEKAGVTRSEWIRRSLDEAARRLEPVPRDRRRG